jgi:ligand-binding sensor domain-containing protein
VLIHSSKRLKNITIGAGRVVTEILEGNNGDLWVGTDGAGLMHYDQNNKLIRHFTDDLSNSLGLPARTGSVNSMFQSQNDSILIGMMQGGIVAFNTVKEKFSSFRYDGTIKDSVVNPVTAIFQDREGYKWFARMQGLVRFNPKDGSVKEYHPDPKDPGSISTDRLSCAIEDRNGNIWIGGGNGEGENTIHRGGLNFLDKRTERFTHYLPGINVFVVYEDAEGTIWTGTAKGLYRLKKGGNIFQPFFDIQSEFYDVQVGGIIEDDHQNLWISSPNAIIKIDRDRNRTYVYGSKFGIEPNNISGAVYKTRNGRILVGNQQGFYSFFPGDLEIKTSAFKVNITDFFINNLPVTPGQKSPLQKPVEEINELVLKYNQDNIGFSFAGVDYKAPESNKYFTKLENYDDTWRETGAEKSAHYFYINPGAYVFRVRAINSDGIVGEKAITIRINPPWWRTWLFRIGAILFLVGLLYSLIRWRLNHKFRVQLERSEKERQMAELKQKELNWKCRPSVRK